MLHDSLPVSLVIYRHVAGPVTVDALDEVFRGLLHVTIHIVWTPGLDLLEVTQRAEDSASEPLERLHQHVPL